MFFCSLCNFKTDIAKNKVLLERGENIDHNDKKSQKDDNDEADNDVFFYCANCGNAEKVAPKTLICSRTSKKRTNLFSNLDMLYDNTLPHTKKYVCDNKKCDTHKNPDIKDAVFYKNNGLITFICAVCKTDWIINYQEL